MESLKMLAYYLGVSQSDAFELIRLILIGICIIGIVIVLCSIKISLNKDKYGDAKVWEVNRICRAIRDSRRR